MSADLIIVIAFLVINLGVGLYYGRNIRTIREYAVGDRNFSTATIAATVIATWISGSIFSITISETYRGGLWFTCAAVGEAISLLIIGWVFGPRMQEFFGALSVAETMGTLYNKKVRIITAVASIAHAIGNTAMQIKVFSSIFVHFLGVNSTYAMWASSFVVIVYSAYGGIKSVTFTDIIQFFTFGVFIPIFAIFIWQVLGSTESITYTFQTNPLFDYQQLFNPGNPNFWPYLFLFLYCLIPTFNSTMFQRTLMARNIQQIRSSFSIAALACLFIHLFGCFIGLVVLSHDTTLDSNNVLMYVIDKYSFSGLKGLALIGIMAMIMSTADSWLNTASVIFTHDFCKPLGVKIKNELFLTQIFTLFIGTAAVLMALSASNLLKLMLLQSNFYMPIVTAPLILAVLGIRSTSRTVLTGMVAGVFTVIIWKIFIQPGTNIDSVVPGLFGNLFVFLFMHYLHLKRNRINILNVKKNSDLERREKGNYFKNTSNFFANLVKNFSAFNLVEYFRVRAPKQEQFYSYFAFGVLTTLITTFSLERETYHQHPLLINLLQGGALFISTIFFCNKLWPEEFREKYIGLIWYISIFMALAFISSFLVLLSKVSHISLVIFILNLTMIGVLVNWQTTMLMLIIGNALALLCYQYFGDFGNPEFSIEFYSVKLKIIYILLMISGFLLIFLKPKQEHHKLTEEKNEHLIDRISAKEKALEKAEGIKEEFIRNMNHEFHAPLTGITSMAETLVEKYDNLNDQMRRMAAETILASARRLDGFESNLETLTKLATSNYQLEPVSMNFSKLVQDRINICKKLYLNNKETLEFDIAVQPNIIVSCDEGHMKQVLDNLIINAINYCKKGTITVKLLKKNGVVEFIIEDEGVGIPREELYDIFQAFTVSSKTRTPAGNRGIGLTLCKRVIELHQGTIWAENAKIGARFIFRLPLDPIS